MRRQTNARVLAFEARGHRGESLCCCQEEFGIFVVPIGAVRSIEISAPGPRVPVRFTPSD